MMKKSILFLLIVLIPILSCSNSAEDYIEKGYEHIIEGDYKEALKDFDKAVELDPRNLEAYNNRGVVLGILGDHYKAIQDFNRAIELKPTDSEAYKSRGVSKLYLEQRQSGCLDLTKAQQMGSLEAAGLVQEFCVR